MKNYLGAILLLMLAFATEPTLQSQQITNIMNRKTISLNGKWNYIIDPYETGYYDNKYVPFDTYVNPPAKAYFMDSRPKSKSDLIEYSFDKSPTLYVPGDWNSQDEKLLYYEGTVWYRRKFTYNRPAEDTRVFVHFGAVNYESHVYMNQKKTGSHTGGFTPFNFEITDLIRDGDNSLIVKADNKRKAEGVPTLNTDWWNYGGITRDVLLIELPSTFIQDYTFSVAPDSYDQITGNVFLNGSRCEDYVTVSIPELKIKETVRTDEKGFGSFNIRTKKLRLWSPEDPYLYTVILTSSLDSVSEKIGFRTIQARGSEILLNGSPVFLRGISIHEENPLRGGRATGPEDARMLLTWAKELNCNYVRLAHYPHSEYMVRLADEMGLMVWEENPVYWTIQWDNPATLDNARKQLGEMVTRDRNRASVIIWSMANETPVIPSRLAFIRSLIEYARSADSSRLISAALEKHQKSGSSDIQVVEDPLAEYIDVLGLNEYIGWYGSVPADIPTASWEIPYDKPLVISEFGGDALYGLHGDRDERWTEEFQDEIYRETVVMLAKIPQFCGVSPWILADFRSPRRTLPGIQDGWNRKGIISETGHKKKAFWTLKSFYDDRERAGTAGKGDKK